MAFGTHARRFIQSFGSFLAVFRRRIINLLGCRGAGIYNVRFEVVRIYGFKDARWMALER